VCAPPVGIALVHAPWLLMTTNNLIHLPLQEQRFAACVSRAGSTSTVHLDAV